MAGPTVLSIGGVSVTASGGLAGALLQSLNNQLSAQLGAGTAQIDAVTVGANGQVTFPPPVIGKTNILALPENAGSGSISIPASYLAAATPDHPLYILYNGTSRVVVHGTPAHPVAVIGDLVLEGGANTVVATNSGDVNDSTAGALLTFFGNDATSGSGVGSYTVNATGASQTLNGANNVQLFATLSGAGSQIQMGNAASTVPVQSNPDFITLTGNADTLFARTGTIYANIIGANDVIYTGNSAETVFATMSSSVPATFSGAGEALVWDTVGGAVINATSNLYYNNNGAAVSTINATSGADTIFAATGVNYQGSGAASTFFVGGAASDSVAAGADATLFSGTGNNFFTVGSSSFLFVANSVASGSATQSILQNASSGSAVIWSGSNENLVMSVQGAAGETNTIGAVGSNMTINAMNGPGGNIFNVFTTADASGNAITGSSTLIGSNAGGDQFNIWVGNTTAHGGTIEIMNWQASDKLFVGDVDNSNASLSATYTAELNALISGTSNTLTLADGTTVVFNIKPTNISHV